MYKAQVNENTVLEVNSKKTKIISSGEQVFVAKAGNGAYEAVINNQIYQGDIISTSDDGKEVKVRINQNTYSVKISDAADLLIDKLGIKINVPKAQNNLQSPMPGLILKINAKVGDEVKKGDTLIILEAMKMENVFKASNDTVIENIYVNEKDSVEKGQILISFK
jgi:biotin carboxyl carrier protein